MKVTVYTKPNCQPCRLTKKRLEELEIKYEEKPVEGHPDVVEQTGAKQAPIVVVEKGSEDWHEFWSGFNPDRIKKIGEVID